LHLHSVAGLRVLMCRSLAQPPCKESICQSSVLKSNVADLNNPAWIDDGTNHARPWEEIHRIGQLLEKNYQDFLSNTLAMQLFLSVPRCWLEKQCHTWNQQIKYDKMGRTCKNSFVWYLDKGRLGHWATVHALH
jgi:hypothetical protein